MTPRTISTETKRILIAGVGNVLHQDDGFGIEVINELIRRNRVPKNVTLQETGIGGIHLVQELYNGYDVLIVVDAVSRDGEPGQLYFLEPEIPDINELSADKKRDFLADMHYTKPSKALKLAKALQILPKEVYILGCQPAAIGDFELGLSDEVTRAIPKAADQIENWIKQQLF